MGTKQQRIISTACLYTLIVGPVDERSPICSRHEPSTQRWPSP